MSLNHSPPEKDPSSSELAPSSAKRVPRSKSGQAFTDPRPEARVQHAQVQGILNSPFMAAQRQRLEAIHTSPLVAAQRKLAQVMGFHHGSQERSTQATESQAAREPKQPHPPRSGEGGIIQRKVGFELEDGSWYSFVREDTPEPAAESPDVVEPPAHPSQEGAEAAGPATGPPPTNIYAGEESSVLHATDTTRRGFLYLRTQTTSLGPAPKKNPPLHQGNGFKIEADGPYGSDKHMDIEVVTDPFEESVAALGELDRVMNAIKTVIDRIGRYAGRDHAQGQFVRPAQHQFSNANVYLSGGSPKGAFKVQVTQGVPLRDIPVLMEYFGTKVPGETAQQTEERAPARRLMRGSEETSHSVSEAIGRSPTMARTVVEILKARGNVFFSEGEDLLSLTGFLSLALLYIQNLKLLHYDGLKTKLPLMSRYSFADLFAKLPESVRHALRDRREVLKWAIRNVMQATEADFRMRGPLMRKIAVSINWRAHQGFFDMLQRLTAEDWLDGILDGVDYLTQQGLVTYLQQANQAIDQYEPSARIFARGHGASETLTPEPAGDLAVIENRMIAPKGSGWGAEDLTMDEAKDLAERYLLFAIQIKNAQGRHEDVGHFPPPGPPQPSPSPRRGGGLFGNFCFLTTACTQARGLPDDCEELTVLRTFRDVYLAPSEEGRRLIEEYYRMAPGLVASINHDSSSRQIYDWIYDIIRSCMGFIAQDRHETARQTYIWMVRQLQQRYRQT